MKKTKLFLGLFLCSSLGAVSTANAAIGFADVVLDFHDSGEGPMTGPYGGEYPGGIGFPVAVSTDVVLGDDGAVVNFLTLPRGSYVTVGFIDEIVFDRAGDEIFIQEVANSGERADIYVSSDDMNYEFLGTANGTTSFDLDSIGFIGNVTSVKVLGLDLGGASPGFDLANVQVSPVPEPSSIALMLGGLGLVGFMAARRKKA